MRISDWNSDVCSSDLLGQVAKETGRTLCVAGRSLDRIITNAKAAGYLRDFPHLVDFDEAMRMPRSKVMIIATGGQGEPRAALARIAGDTHSIKLDKGDLVVFSSKQIPGNEIAIGKIRSEEHTSELQSLMRISYAVFCLKKKHNTTSNR